MIPAALSLLFGELLSAWLPLEPWTAAGLGAACLLGAWLPIRSSLAGIVRCLAVASIGAWLASNAAQPPTGGCDLPAVDEPRKLWIEARVDDAPVRLAEGLRMVVTAHDAASGSRICGRVLLTVAESDSVPAPGDRLRLHATLRRTRNFANPRAYDQIGSLARRGIWATAHSSGRDLVRLGVDRGRRFWLGRERQRIGRLIDEAVPAADAGLLRSLVVGDEASVAADMWSAVAAAGLAHLLSVSGLHIALVWGIAFAGVHWLLARSERLLLVAHVRAWAALVALLPAVVYAALAGFSVPAARSVMMTALLVASLGVGREVGLRRVLCGAAMAVAVIRPGSPLDVSFQLSFASVLALVLAGEAWTRRWPAERDEPWSSRLRRRAVLGLIVPAAALLGTAPLVALHFNRLTPIGLLTNPVLVPLAGTPATLLGVMGAIVAEISEPCARWIFALARWPLDLLRFGVTLAAAAPFGNVRVPTPTILEVALCYALLGLPWIPGRGRGAIAMAASSLLLMDVAAWTHQRWLHEDLRVRFLDVGQGDAAVIELPGGRVVVLDGGGFARSTFDVGERVLAPYLWSRKIMRVDVLVATHGDWDHQGGLHFLARELAPRELWTAGLAKERARLARLEDEVRAAGGSVRVMVAGDATSLGEAVHVECLHPPPTDELSSNDSSLVLLLRFGRASFLFTGDVESSAEAMMAEGRPPEAVTVLKVPHHGSATSSSERFLRWTTPEVAVFSLGAGNGYGFPHPPVLARHRRMGTRCLRTDRDGSIAISTRGETLAVQPLTGSSPAVCSLLGMLC